eukprot:6226950-Pyramimonas_sp.AAC.1
MSVWLACGRPSPRCSASLCAALHYTSCAPWSAPPVLHQIDCTTFVASRKYQDITAWGWHVFNT